MEKFEIDVFLSALESGKMRVIQRDGEAIMVDASVKERILQIFKHSKLSMFDHTMSPRSDEDDARDLYIDKEDLPARRFTSKDGIRIVPGGSAVRRGAYIGKKCVIMPPSYVNIGAYIDEATMIDSNVLIGSCAQIGKRVHISAGVQIGGVLEPINSHPVIVEDDCFVGAGSVLVDGVRMCSGSVLATGVMISSRTIVYDIVHQREFRGFVPKNAVVISGMRKIASERDYAKQKDQSTEDFEAQVKRQKYIDEHQLSAQCAIIVKYRDESTDASVAIEEALR